MVLAAREIGFWYWLHIANPMIVIRKVTLILGTICFLLRLDEKKNGNVFISAACNEQAIDNIDKPSTAATLWWVEWIVRRILYCRQNSIVLILAFAEYGAQVFQLRPVITTMKLIEMTVIITILDILSLRHIWIKWLMFEVALDRRSTLSYFLWHGKLRCDYQ